MSFLKRIIGFLRRSFLRVKAMPLFQNISRSSFIGGLALSLIVGGWYVVRAGTTSSTASSEEIVVVERRDIVTTIKALGKVTFASEQQLKFNLKGTVTKVNAKEGDVVKKGQVLAELDKSSVLADVRQAQLQIGASALQLQQLENDREKTLADARNDLKTAQEKLPADVASAERALVEKKAALTQAKSDLDKQQNTELQNLGLTAQSTLTASQKLLDSFYGLLTRDQSSRPPETELGNGTSFEIDHYLYNDQAMKIKVQNDFITGLQLAKKMRDSYGSALPSQRDTKVLLAALTDAQKLAEAVHRLGEDSYALLQGATTDTSSFTTSDLQGYRNTVNTNRSTAAGLVDAVVTAQANLAAASTDEGIPSVTLQQKKDAVQTATNAVQQAEDNLQVLKTQTPGDLQSMEHALNSAVATTATNIQLKKNDIAQKSTSLQKTQQNLKDYQLVAPFDGILTHIDYKVGDNLLDTGDTETAVLQNRDFVVVTIPLDQVDVVHVRTGLPAVIVFDALVGKTFDAVIDSIDPTPIEQSGVVSYEVKLKMPTPQNLTILSGMTTTVTIETEKRTAVLAVPNLALQHAGNLTTVKTAAGQSVPVETGLTDGRYTEVTSGVREGEGIVSVNIVTGGASSANANSAQQIFRLGGGGGSFAVPAGGGGGVRRQ